MDRTFGGGNSESALSAKIERPPKEKLILSSSKRTWIVPKKSGGLGSMRFKVRIELLGRRNGYGTRIVGFFVSYDSRHYTEALVNIFSPAASLISTMPIF
jgi:hypothetical protein